MIAFAYFLAAVLLAYWVGSRNTGAGILVFFVSVAIWQMAVDGPESFLAPVGCDYGHAAQDC